MANKLQKFIYTWASLAPYFLIWAVVDYLQTRTISATIVILFGISVVWCLYVCIFFIGICNKKLEKKNIKIESFTVSDNASISFYVEWFSAILTFWFSNIFGLILFIAILMIMTIIRNVVPSPLLLVRGYHFHTITLADGGGEYMLVTKIKLNNNAQISSAKVVFDYFLIV